MSTQPFSNLHLPKMLSAKGVKFFLTGDQALRQQRAMRLTLVVHSAREAAGALSPNQCINPAMPCSSITITSSPIMVDATTFLPFVSSTTSNDKKLEPSEELLETLHEVDIPGYFHFLFNMIGHRNFDCEACVDGGLCAGEPSSEGSVALWKGPTGFFLGCGFFNVHRGHCGH